MKNLFLLLFIFSAGIYYSQFAPPVGQTGTTAMYKDSSAFVNWASTCTIVRGYQDISDTASGFASVGDSTMALGTSGSNGVVSLGDGGIAILQFPFPIQDGPGNDFAVFENSFSDDYLELAFVEVSSDGINYFRFPAASNTQDTVQVGPFDLLDATKLNNLAGKYRMFYGTPFDLNELAGTAGLDVFNITHVKLIDVVGSIQIPYASTDVNSKKINDPWSTPFPSSGFDLDAVGVIHENSQIGISENYFFAKGFNSWLDENSLLHVSYTSKLNGKIKTELSDLSGRKIKTTENYCNAGEFYNFSYNLPELVNGVYFVNLCSQDGKKITKKIFIP